MDTELLLFLFAIVVDAVVVVAVVVVAVVFVVLPAPSTILNSERMSAATLVANSRSAPRCYPEGLLRSAPQGRARDTGAGAVSPGTRARGTGRSRGGTAEWAAPRPTAGPCPRRLTSPSHTCHLFGAEMWEALRLASDTSHALSAAFMIVFFDNGKVVSLYLFRIQNQTPQTQPSLRKGRDS